MRIRTIKPEFFTHEGLFDLEKETGLPMRVAYAGLWSAADREGRFKWEPRRLGVSILPYDNVDFSRVLHACLTRGFIVKYRVGNAWFGAIPSFTQHQIINNRESPSVIPSPNEADEVFSEEKIRKLTRAPRVKHAKTTRAPRHLRGREGKGREGKGKGYIAPASADAPAIPSSSLPGLDETEPPPQPHPSPTPRDRNPLFDALADVDGSDPTQLTKPAARAVGVALADIRRVAPGLTPDEIRRRAAHYRSHFQGVTLTASALAKHWARCDRPPARSDSGSSRPPNMDLRNAF